MRHYLFGKGDWWFKGKGIQEANVLEDAGGAEKVVVSGISS